jgi:flagellar protein FliO/FliZ
VLRRIAPAPALAPGVFVLFAFCLETAVAAAPPAGAGSTVAAGSVAQVVIGLALVLALFGAIAWVLKRYSGLRASGSGLIRIIGGAAVGQRERIVLVEVGGTWLLLGVAPGQVRTLHSMPKNESAAAPDAVAPADQGFASRLRRMLEKRNHA